MKRTALSIAVWLFCASSAGLCAEPADMLILTPRDLAGAAELLARHRQAGGLSVRVEAVEDIPGEGDLSPERVKGFVEKAWEESGKKLRFLLLMGDAPQETDALDKKVRIPPKILEPRYGDPRWPYDDDIASDTWFGMMDGDLFPELAVGRLPADRKSEAEPMVRRIIAYEESPDFGPWRKTLNVIAGTGGFGPVVDAFLESTFKKYMTELLDPAFDVTLTYGNPQSPFCFPPPRFSEKVVERINAGSLVTAYVGHGSTTRFDSVRWKKKRYAICDRDAVGTVEVARGSPVVVILACSTGQFDHPLADCISEKLLEREKGPVAVFSSTRISHPYANGILGRELIVHLMNPAHPTLGEAVLAVKRALVEAEGEEQKVLDRFAALIMKPGTLKPCREDHVHLFNLFGDPAMRMAYPRGKATLAGPERAEPGAEIEVKCELDAPVKGEAVLTLEARRGTVLKSPDPVKGLPEEEAFETMASNWARANDWVVARAALRVDGVSFSFKLAVPAGSYPSGEYFLKVYVAGEKRAAIGVAKIMIAGGEPGDGEGGEEDGF